MTDSLSLWERVRSPSAPWSSAASGFAEDTLGNAKVRKELARFVLVNLNLNLELQKKNDHEYPPP